MEPNRLVDAATGEPISVAVEQRQVSPAALAAVQALQNALLALEAQAGYLRTQQLQLIAADTGADFATETWVIDVQNGTLERHEVQGVISAPEPATPKRTRKPRTKAVAAVPVES